MLKTLKRILENLEHLNFFKSVFVVSSGTIISQIIGFLTAPIISRMYTKIVIGENAIIISIASILIFLASLGLNSSIMIAENDDEAKKIFMVNIINSVFITLIIGILFFVIVLLFKIEVIQFNPLLMSCILVMFILLTNLRSLLLVYANRRKNNKAIIFGTISFSLSNLILIVIFGLLNFELLGLFLSFIFASIISSLVFILFENPIKRISYISDCKNIFKDYLDFIRYQMPANFISNLGNQIPTQIFGASISPDTLSLYSMNERVLSNPMKSLSGSIGNIYFRTAKDIIRKDEDLSIFSFKLVKLILLSSLIPVILLIIFSEDIFGFILGIDWRSAGELAKFLIIPYVLNFISIVMAYTRVVYNKLGMNFFLGILKLIIVASTIAIAFYFNLSFLSVIRIYSIVLCTYYMIEISINFYIMKKRVFINMLTLLVYIIILQFFAYYI